MLLRIVNSSPLTGKHFLEFRFIFKNEFLYYLFRRTVVKQVQKIQLNGISFFLYMLKTTYNAFWHAEPK